MIPLRLPWLWLLGAPVSVVAGLFIWRNVFLVFAVYHLGICLVLPALRNVWRGPGSWREHFTALGLSGSGTARGIILGLGLGALMSAGTVLVFRWQGEFLLAGQDVPAVLASWGVGESSLDAMFLVMILVNGPAEELYWRGFIHTGLRDRGPRWGILLLIAACYASYHTATVYYLLPDSRVAVTALAVILATGFFWGWLREKTGSVWPALLSHTGAAATYMWVVRPLLAG